MLMGNLVSWALSFEPLWICVLPSVSLSTSPDHRQHGVPESGGFMATSVHAEFFKTHKVKDCRSGGCALRGAKLALQPITDAVHVVHGSASCLGHVWASRPTVSSGSQLHRHSVTTALGELELVLGGSERLQHLLDRVVNEFHPAAIFVYQSCLTSMIGEDLRAECKLASQRLRLPVLAIEASGLDGGKQTGHRLAVKALCEDVIGTIEPANLATNDINLIGEFNVHGEVAELRALLRSFGIRILASIPGDASYREIATAHRAHVSLDLCSQSMPHLAEFLRSAFDIPIVRGSLYGSRAFSDTLQKLVEALLRSGADPSIADKVNGWLADEQCRFSAALAELRSRLAGKRVMIHAGGVKSWSLIEDLQSAGLVIRGVSLHKSSDQDKTHHDVLRQRCHQAGLQEWQQDHLDGLLSSGGVDLVLSGGGMKFSAHKYGIPCVDVSHERSFSLLGFTGMINLLSEIDQFVNSPIPRFVQGYPTEHPSHLHRTTAEILPAPHGRIRPFALSQPTGAVLAVQGVRACSALIFGSQGCASSDVVFLNRYFAEQIDLTTVQMSECDTIYGGARALKDAITVLEESASEMIAVISTGTMELQGCSRFALPTHANRAVPQRLFLHVPDFEGCLEEGWAMVSNAIVQYALRKSSPHSKCALRRLLILPGVHLSIADLEWLKEVVRVFGFDPLIVPDISTALDGHSGDSAVFDGGVSLNEIEQIASCVCFLAFGNSQQNSARALSDAGMKGRIFASWTGITSTDEILNQLSLFSGQPIPDKHRVQRERVLDSMIDHMRSLTGKRAAIAAEPDLLLDLCSMLSELGINDIVAVSPISTPSLGALPVDKVYVGDYLVVAEQLHGCDMLFAPDSARDIATKANVAHYPIGIHEPHLAGQPFRMRMGYNGLQNQIYSLVNLLS